MQKNSKPKIAISGVAWYRADQWQRLLEVSDDYDELEATYLEWLTTASNAINQLKQRGINAIKVDIDVEELIDWCKANGYPINSEARSKFVVAKLRQQRNGGMLNF